MDEPQPCYTCEGIKPCADCSAVPLHDPVTGYHHYFHDSGCPMYQRVRDMKTFAAAWREENPKLDSESYDSYRTRLFDAFWAHQDTHGRY